MRAVVFETPGLENLRVIDNADEPKVSDHDVLIQVKVAGVNPIDHLIASGALPKVHPHPHIPGTESSGIVEELGNHVNNSEIRKGDRKLYITKYLMGPAICVLTV